MTIGLIAAPATVIAHAPPSGEIAVLTRQIEQHPDDAELHLRRGDLHRLEGRRRLALADLERAAALAPDFDEVDLSLAALFLDLDRPEDARRSIDRYVRRHPDHAEALLLRARALEAVGEWQEAVDDLERVLRTAGAPRPFLYLERASLTARLGRPERALAGIEEGLARLGPVVTLELRAIELETELGRWDAALSRIERVASGYPRRETMHARRGDVLLAAGRTLEAQAAYTDALDAIALLPPDRRDTRAVQELEERVRARLHGGGTP